MQVLSRFQKTNDIMNVLRNNNFKYLLKKNKTFLQFTDISKNNHNNTKPRCSEIKNSC